MIHGFDLKMAIFPTFFFSNIGREHVFYDIVERKNVFLGLKNKNFKKLKNWHFSMEWSMELVQKMDIFPTFLFMLLKRGTRSGERGTGNGSLGTSCQRKPPQKSKMAVQKKGIHALVEIRWGRNCKSDSPFTFTFWAGGMFFRYPTCFIYNMIRS